MGWSGGRPPSPGGSGSPGALLSADVRITEQADNGHSYAITDVDTAAGTFTIAGDHAADFIPFDTFAVVGSSANDANFLIGSASVVDGATVILSPFAALDPTIDGTIFSSNYRAAIPIPAGSIVRRVIAYGEAEWAADAALLSTFDANAYLQGVACPVAAYDPLSPDIGNSYLTSEIDSSGISFEYAAASTNYAKDGTKSWLNPGVPYTEDININVTVLAHSATPPVPAGVTRVKIEYFAPATAIDATFA